MPKYDAFGREIGENTLEGLGGTSDATVRPAPAPAPEPSAEPAEPTWSPPPAPETPVFTVPDAQPRPFRVRRARGLGCLVGLVILAAVVAGPIFAVVSLVSTATDTIDGVTGVFDDVDTSAPEVADPPEVAPPPAGVEGRSMLAKDNISGALSQLRGDGVDKVVRVAIWPDRLEAEAIKGGRVRNVQFSYEGGVQRGDASPVNAASGSIKVAALDPGAPARLVRNAAEKYPVRVRGINYVIASDAPIGGGHRWIAYFKNGVYVEGDERGRVIRRIS